MGFRLDLAPLGDVFKSFGDSKYVKKVEEAKRKESELMQLVNQYQSTTDPNARQQIEQQMDTLIAGAQLTIDDPSFLAKARGIAEQITKNRPTDPREMGRVSDRRGNTMFDPNKAYNQEYEIGTGFNDIMLPTGGKFHDSPEFVKGKGALNTLDELRRVAELEGNAYQQYFDQTKNWINDEKIMAALPDYIKEDLQSGDMSRMAPHFAELSRISKKVHDLNFDLDSPVAEEKRQVDIKRGIEKDYKRLPSELDISAKKQTASILNKKKVESWLGANDPVAAGKEIQGKIDSGTKLIKDATDYIKGANTVRSEIIDSEVKATFDKLEGAKVNGIPGVENHLDLQYQLDALAAQTYPEVNSFMLLDVAKQGKILEKYTNAIRKRAKATGETVDDGLENYVDQMVNKHEEIIAQSMDLTLLDTFSTQVMEYSSLLSAGKAQRDTAADRIGEAVVRATLNPEVAREVELPVSPNYDPGTGITVGEEVQEYVDSIARLLLKQDEEGLTSEEQSNLTSLVRLVGTTMMKYKPVVPSDQAYFSSNPKGERSTGLPEAIKSKEGVGITKTLTKESTPTDNTYNQAIKKQKELEAVPPEQVTPWGPVSGKQYQQVTTRIDRILIALSKKDQKKLIRLASGDITEATLTPIYNELNDTGDLNMKDQGNIRGAVKQLIMQRADSLLNKDDGE